MEEPCKKKRFSRSTKSNCAMSTAPFFEKREEVSHNQAAGCRQLYGENRDFTDRGSRSCREGGRKAKQFEAVYSRSIAA